MDPFILLRLPVMATRYVVQRVGWKVVIGGWVASIVGIFIYAVLGLASDAVVRMVEARALSYRRSLGS